MTAEHPNLPGFLEPFFWDIDFKALTLAGQRDFIIRRLLQTGSWQALTWLRAELGDSGLRQWIEQRRGAGLTPRQLRFWAVVLDMPRSQVTRWVHTAGLWERRLAR